MPNTRVCRDCSASLALYWANVVRCDACRAAKLAKKNTVVRACRDCGTSLTYYNGNCVRCYACRAVNRREIHNRADKKRRKLLAAQMKAKREARALLPAPVEEPVIVHRVTAKQVAAYMQAYAPAAYNKVVRDIRRMLNPLTQSANALTTQERA